MRLKKKKERKDIRRRKKEKKEEEPQGGRKMKVFFFFLFRWTVEFCAATARPRQADTLRSSWRWTETFGIVCPGFTQPNSVKRRRCYCAPANETNSRVLFLLLFPTRFLATPLDNKVYNSCYYYCYCRNENVFLRGVTLLPK